MVILGDEEDIKKIPERSERHRDRKKEKNQINQNINEIHFK